MKPEPEWTLRARRLREEGMSWGQLEKTIGVSKWTIRYWVHHDYWRESAKKRYTTSSYREKSSARQRQFDEELGMVRHKYYKLRQRVREIAAEEGIPPEPLYEKFGLKRRRDT